MSFTRENLNELNARTKAVKEAEDHASELLRIAQDRFKQRTHKLMREGKEIEVTEKVLWDEVFYIGPASQAGQILTKAHPQVFEAYRKQDAAAAELKKFCVVEIGVDYTKITLSDYLTMTESLFELLLSERGLPTKSPLSGSLSISHGPEESEGGIAVPKK